MCPDVTVIGVGSRVRQTPEEGRRTYRPKRCGNNNKDEDNSPKTLNDKNQQASSQKFRQLSLCFSFLSASETRHLLFFRDTGSHAARATIQKDTKWSWFLDCQKAFDKIVNVELRPTSSTAGFLMPVECDYRQVEKEALALIFTVKKFHKMLFGCHSTLLTAQKPLFSIFGAKKGIPVYSASRLQR